MQLVPSLLRGHLSRKQQHRHRQPARIPVAHLLCKSHVKSLFPYQTEKLFALLPDADLSQILHGKAYPIFQSIFTVFLPHVPSPLTSQQPAEGSFQLTGMGGGGATRDLVHGQGKRIFHLRSLQSLI